MSPQCHVRLSNKVLDSGFNAGVVRDYGFRVQLSAYSRLQYSTVKILQTVNLLPWSCTGDYKVDQCSESTPTLCRPLDSGAGFQVSKPRIPNSKNFPDILGHRGYLVKYRKIQKISLGAYIFQRPILRGLCMEGKFALKNRLGQPCSWKDIYRFSLFYFVFEGNFQVQSPPGGLYLERRLNGGFFALRVSKFGGLIFGVAYTWRGLFSEFYGI